MEDVGGRQGSCTRAVLALSTAMMPLPVRLCRACQALSLTSRGKDRPDSHSALVPNPLHCSSSGSFPRKINVLSVIRQIYICFLFLPGACASPDRSKGRIPSR